MPAKPPSDPAWRAPQKPCPSGLEYCNGGPGLAASPILRRALLLGDAMVLPARLPTPRRPRTAAASPHLAWSRLRRIRMSSFQREEVERPLALLEELLQGRRLVHPLHPLCVLGLLRVLRRHRHLHRLPQRHAAWPMSFQRIPIGAALPATGKSSPRLRGGSDPNPSIPPSLASPSAPWVLLFSCSSTHSGPLRLIIVQPSQPSPPNPLPDTTRPPLASLFP